MTFDFLDALAFLVMLVLLAAIIILVVVLGQLPGQIAAKRNHPQAAAINVASWIGVATMGLFWPIAFIWAFSKPVSATSCNPEGRGQT